MKPTPKTPGFQRFTDAMRAIMSVPKSKILEAEKREKEERKAKRSSASDGRASREQG